MINFNGEILKEEDVNLSFKNRGLKYGDSIFETIKVINGSKVVFWEDHYFRLMSSMRMLRMKIPMSFTLEFLENQILALVKEKKYTSKTRVRFTVFRKEGGLYTPNTNQIDFLIEANEIEGEIKQEYKVDIFKDFYNYSGLLSTIKTNNKILNTLASIFAKENDLDNCILINENKSVVEVTNGNIFILKENIIKTPPVSAGCIKGVVRKKIIEILNKNKDFEIQETSISPFEIQKADEVFITNAIIGIQPVTQYKKKKFKSEFGLKLLQSLKVLEFSN